MVLDRTPQDQYFLLACDGIWDCMSNDEAGERINEEMSKLKEWMPKSNAIGNLMDQLICPKLEKGVKSGTDNMTCMIVYFKHDVKEKTGGCNIF